MPKLWKESIDAHRHAVRQATLDAAARLVAENGLRSVTMSRIAQETGIARATLYTYFPDVEAVLAAWHERQVTGHLTRLAALRDGPGDPGRRLAAVLEGYASAVREGDHGELAASLHGGDHVARAREHLRDLVRALIAEGAAAGTTRSDVPPAELADYCLYALTAARAMSSRTAVRRLVTVTLSGLAPPS